MALQVYQISRVVIGKFHQQSKLYPIQNIYRHCPCEYKMLPLGTYYCCENKWHDRIMWDVYIMLFLVMHSKRIDHQRWFDQNYNLFLFCFQCVKNMNLKIKSPVKKDWCKSYVEKR